MSVSHLSNDRSRRENESAPEQSANSARDLPQPLQSAEGAVVDTIHAGSDKTEQVPNQTRRRGLRGTGDLTPEQAVPVLQRLLAAAIVDREKAVEALAIVHEQPLDRHWFVAGEGGYCAACGLPEKNKRRHTARAA